MNDLSPGKLWGLRRLADADGRFKMLAVDQRPPITHLVAERRGVDIAPYDDVCAVKAVLTEELAGECSAVLLDPHYAYPAAVHLVSPTQGVLLTLEDSVFSDDQGGRRSSSIDEWSVEKIKRAGGDAVKLLAWYRPDVSTNAAGRVSPLDAGPSASPTSVRPAVRRTPCSTTTVCPVAARLTRTAPSRA